MSAASPAAISENGQLQNQWPALSACRVTTTTSAPWLSGSMELFRAHSCSQQAYPLTRSTTGCRDAVSEDCSRMYMRLDPFRHSVSAKRQLSLHAVTARF